VTAAELAAPGIDREGRAADLDSLPFPAWDLLPLDRSRFMTIFTSRGCNDTCTFCPYIVGQGRRFRPRAPERVVDEMAWLAEAFRPSRLIVRDPVFALERSRVEQICQGLIAGKLALSWECESRPEHFDASLLRLMKRAGCTTIKLGLETTSESVLRDLKRIPPTGSAQTYLEQTTALVAACRAVGLACRLFVMTGLPGQSEEDIVSTIAFVRRLRPTATHVKPFHRYPGLLMPGVQTATERERGEMQATMVRQALTTMQPRRVPKLVQTARRWLARRIRR
jgi:radical SAM superfamily enzyme YgiQ (UPF0313 family)